MYRALQRQMPGKALDMMNDAVALTGSKVSSILGRITSLPGMTTVFLSVMRYMVKTMFGIDAGFSHTIHQTDKTVFKVDITQCPYCHYCRLCHCPELAPNFCISDVYCYGNLPGVVFTRTGTIGTGATCCDFTFALEKKK